MRLFLLCPGRGSYGKTQLGNYQSPSAVLDKLDTFRANLGRPTLRAMDAAERHGARFHVAGENASILTFGATAFDIEALDPTKSQIVAVGGNSMGWYSALYAAGALALSEAAWLIETMGQYQAKNIIGGQVLYPTVDTEWRPDAGLSAAVDAALDMEEVHLSIRLGGTAVLAGTRRATKALLASLPKLERGKRSYPVQLPLHSAFHTPLMSATAYRARVELADLALHSPEVPLVDGRGAVFHPWASPQEIFDWTLGAQVDDTYDFSATVQAGVGQFAPDAIVLPGPGDTLGASVAQALIEIRWRGLRDKADFSEAQKADTPLVISMSRAEQRALVV
ncbi:MAG: [acyl-carrier-protein] S-malonyltransferase [Cognaticolwellia sp.]|jgi:[acyl-carrier-protein] S-malonyltransferase